MEKVNSFGAIKVSMMEISIKITFMVKVNTSGLMAEYLTDNGLITKWKVMEHSHGPMDVDTQDNTKMTKNTDKVLSIGPTAENTLVNGVKVSNMEKAHT